MVTEREMNFEQQIFGEYRLLERLGTGSFGIVFLGEHIYTRTRAAVKILKTSMLEKCRAQFSKETEILSSVRHENIVAFYTSGTNGNRPFLVMEYVSRGNLRQLYKDPKPPLVNVVSYVQQIANALQHIHDNGIVHGDIRPEHILIGDKNNLLLCDFGMALYIGRSVFTLDGWDRNKAYMAPEQIEKKTPTFATDQFALAVMVFELLSGKRPFEGDTQNQQGGNSLPRIMNVPPHVEVVLQKALNRDPDQRYKSVKEFSDALWAASRQTLPVPSDFHYQPEIDDGPSKSPAPQSHPSPANVTPVLSRPNREQRNFSRRSFLEVASIIIMGVTGGGLLGSWVKFGSEASVSSMLAHSSTFAPGDTINIYHGHRHTDNVDGNVNGLAWSPDGKRIASASFDHTVQVWDALNGDNLIVYTGHTSHVNDVAWSPNGKLIASCSGQSDGKDCTVHVWDAFSGMPISLFKGHRESVNALAWSPDSKYVASANFDGSVIVSEAMTGIQSGFSVPLGHEAFAVAWSPDGNYIAAASDKDSTVSVWQFSQQKRVATYSGQNDGVLSLAWLPNLNSQYIASGSSDKSVQVWEVATESESALFPSKGLNGVVRKVVWSPNGKYIAAGTLNSTVEVWNAQTGEDLPGGDHTYGLGIQINALAWSPDGTKMASGSSDATVRVWQVL